MVNIIGHRGAAFEEPENTLRGFLRALDAGAAGVELDVQMTKDGRLAVIHDETVDRTTDGFGRVRDFTLAELQKLDAGQGERIPALEEVVELVRGRGQLLVELKHPESAPALLRLCREGGLFEDIRAISFWHPVVKALREQEPRLRTGALMAGCPVDPRGLARAALTDTLVLNYRYVDRDLADAAHRQGVKVIVWNIDDPISLEPYTDMNLEAICTNRPGEIINYLRRISEASQ
ncbi:MAG: glycerophosphodiester phosphodiesterase [Deltaproteobacteria bacterium]|nr:MAG: glycerophosphodiester phosphodiesterase [Deltaproteobacteria bacterium]